MARHRARSNAFKRWGSLRNAATQDRWATAKLLFSGSKHTKEALLNEQNYCQVNFAPLSILMVDPPSSAVRVHAHPDGSLAVFHGPRCLARYDADGDPINQEGAMLPAA